MEMLTRIKNMFGIDGVKINIDADSDIDLTNSELKFDIAFSSKTDLVVDWVTVKVIEKYKRGWGDSKLIDEYILHESTEELDLLISAEEKLVAPIKVKLDYQQSEVERMGNKRLLRPFVKAAMVIKRVSSNVRIEVSAKVKGVKMNPLATHHFSKVRKY